MADNISNLATRKRRSSILKTQRSRAPLSDIELSSPTSSEITSKSRRVSFSRKQDVAEFVADEATTAWKNFYEEHNNHTLELSENEVLPPGFKKPSKTAEILMHHRNPKVQHDISNFQDLSMSQRVRLLESQKEQTKVAFIDKHEMSVMTSNNFTPFSDSIGGCFGMEMTRIYDNDVALVGDPSDNHIDAANIFRQLQEIGIYSEDVNTNDGVSDEDMLKRMAHDFGIDFNGGKTHDKSDMSITEPVQARVKDDRINNRNKNISLPFSEIDKENIAVNPMKKVDMTGYKQDKVLVYDGEKVKYEDTINDMINELGLSRPHNVTSHDTFLTCSDISLGKTRSSSSICKIESKSEVAPGNGSQPISLDSIRTVFSDKISVSRASANSFKITSRMNDSETSTNDSSTFSRNPSASILEKKSSETIVFDEQEVIMTQTILQKLIEAKQANKTIVFSKQPDRFLDNLNSDTRINKNIDEFQLTESSNKLNNNDTSEKPPMEVKKLSVMPELVPSVDTKPSQLDNNLTIYFDPGQQDISMTQIVSKNIFQNDEASNYTQKTIFFNEQDANLSITQAFPKNILQEICHKTKEKSGYYDNEDLEVSEAVPNKNFEVSEISKQNFEGLLEVSGKKSREADKSSSVFQKSEADKVQQKTSESNQCTNKTSVADIKSTVFFKDTTELSTTKTLPNRQSFSHQNLDLDTNSQKYLYFSEMNSDISMTQPVLHNILSQIKDSQKTICFSDESADISMTKAVPQNLIIKSQQDNHTTIGGFADMSFTKAIPQNIFQQNVNTDSQATLYFDNNAELSMTNIIPTKDTNEITNYKDLMKHNQESYNETNVENVRQKVKEEPLERVMQKKETGKLSPDRAFTQTLSEQIKLKVQQKQKEYQESIFRKYLKSDSVDNDSETSYEEPVADKTSENSMITDYHHNMKSFISANGKSPLTFNELSELNKIKKIKETDQMGYNLSGKSEKLNQDHSQNTNKSLGLPKACFDNLLTQIINQSSEYTLSEKSDYSQSNTIPRNHTSTDCLDTESQQLSSKEMAKMAFLKTLADVQTPKPQRPPHKITGINYEYKGYDRKNPPEVIQKFKLISSNQPENNKIQDHICCDTQNMDVESHESSTLPKPPPPFLCFLEYQNVAMNSRKSTTPPVPPPKPLSPPKILKFEHNKGAKSPFKKSGGVKIIDNKSLFDQIQEKLASFRKKACEEDDDDRTIAGNSNNMSKDVYLAKCSSPDNSIKSRQSRPLSPMLPQAVSNAKKDEKSLFNTSAKALASVIKGTPEKTYEKELKNVLENALAKITKPVQTVLQIDPTATDFLKKTQYSPKSIPSNVSSVCSKKSTKRSKDDAAEPKKIPSLVNVQRKTVRDLRKFFGDAHASENDDVDETIEELTEPMTPCESVTVTHLNKPCSEPFSSETQTIEETDDSVFQTASASTQLIPIDDPDSECIADKDHSEIRNSDLITLTKATDMTSTTSGTSGVDDVPILVNDGDVPGAVWHKSDSKQTVTSAINLDNQDTDQPTTSNTNISSEESSQSKIEYICQDPPKSKYTHKAGEKHYEQESTVATAKVEPSISLKAEIEKYIEITKNQTNESDKKTSPRKSPKKGQIKEQLVSDVIKSPNSNKKNSKRLTDTSESMKSDSPTQNRRSSGKNRTYVIETNEEPGRILAINSINGISSVDEAIRSALDHMKKHGSIEFLKMKNKSPSKISPKKLVKCVKDSKNTSNDSVTPSNSVNSDSRSSSPGRKVRFENENADGKPSWPQIDDCENIENISQNILNVTNDSDETLCSPKSQVKILYLGADDLSDNNKNNPTTVFNASVKVRCLPKVDKPKESVDAKEEKTKELRKAVEVVRREDQKQKNKPVPFQKPEASKVIRVSDVDLTDDIVTEIDALPFIGEADSCLDAFLCKTKLYSVQIRTTHVSKHESLSKFSKSCSWEAMVGDTWSFRLLRSRLRVVFTFEDVKDSRCDVGRNSVVKEMLIEGRVDETTQPLGYLTCKLAVARLSAARVRVSCRRARHVAAALSTVVHHTEMCLAWAKRMHQGRMVFAYTLDKDGILQFNFTSLVIFETWLVRMRIALEPFDGSVFPRATEVTVRSPRGLLAQQAIYEIIKSVPLGWDNVLTTVKSLAKFLKQEGHLKSQLFRP